MIIRRAIAVIAFLILDFTWTIPLNPIFQPVAANLTASTTQCAASPLWVGSGIIYEHCLEAISFFHRALIQKDTHQIFEFRSYHVPPHYGIPSIVTPSKYIFKSCAIVIATMSSIPAAYLPPGADQWPYPPSDVETFATIQTAIMLVESVCIRYSPLLAGGGWLPVGQKNQALGVFIWSRDSFMNRMIQ